MFAGGPERGLRALLRGSGGPQAPHSQDGGARRCGGARVALVLPRSRKGGPNRAGLPRARVKAPCEGAAPAGPLREEPSSGRGRRAAAWAPSRPGFCGALRAAGCRWFLLCWSCSTACCLQRVFNNVRIILDSLSLYFTLFGAGLCGLVILLWP